MSVAYWTADGSCTPLEDEDGERFAYHVAEQSGVLIIMQQIDAAKPWRVYRELSASGWLEVTGTRFNKYPSSAEGLDGKATFPASKMQVL